MPIAMDGAEADAVAAGIPQRQSPAMSWGDTLGDMALLDEWRRVTAEASAAPPLST
jgi:hypothetical protein